MEVSEGISPQEGKSGKDAKRKIALKFVLMIGVLASLPTSLMKVLDPSLARFFRQLEQRGVVGNGCRFGELLGYGLRFFSGPLSERTGEFWPITFLGYIVQMAAVPLLAFAGTGRLPHC